MIEIRLDGSSRTIAPGDPVRGNVHWMEDAAPDLVEVRILWYTEGRGDQDVSVARRVQTHAASSIGSCPFDFEAPSGPYSCSGRLVSVCWAIEAVTKPGGEVARVPWVLAPGGREVELGQPQG